MLQTDSLSRAVLDRMHPSAIEGSADVHALMVRLWRDSIPLRRGVNRQISPEIARIDRVEEHRLHLSLNGFEPSRRTQLWLNFELDALSYFFSARIVQVTPQQAVTDVPELVYRAERRDRVRAVRVADDGGCELVTFDAGGESSIAARVADRSADGVGLEVPLDVALRVGAPVVLRVTDSEGHPAIWKGRLRHAGPSGATSGWQRAGVSLLGPISGDSRLIEPAAPAPSWQKARRAWETVAASVVARSEKLVSVLTRRTETKPRVDILNFESKQGEQIRAIANWSRRAEDRSAPLVVIPPAWGRTKETLLPLAAILVETFDRADEPVIVVRFDGIRRRGESYNDPDCRAEGAEHHRFCFSQGVEDIHTVIAGLRKRTDLRPSQTILVTFSAASIDGRRAVALNESETICGWVSVVGSADLQSMMRVVSGGVDYVSGADRGLSFGLQEVLGVEVDIDFAARDALEKRMAFLEDSCRDMEGIRVPITWIHGRHDAWMDLERSRLMLSCGDRSNRKLVIVPTGHQLRTSREAFEVFQLVAQEVSRIFLGRELTPRIPNLTRLESRRRAERDRLPRKVVDRRSFWKRYLLGQEGSVGIELMTYSSSYLAFMLEQISALELRNGERVADLGSGTGAFISSLSRAHPAPNRVSVVELDYVPEALARARDRASTLLNAPATSFVACDLSAGDALGNFPLKDSSCDAVLASLFISYVTEPVAVLQEVHRILKPGGHLVVSGLRKDADISRLFVEATAEIAAGGGINTVEGAGAIDLERAGRDFLNDATRLLDLEELGVFEFRDGLEMAELLESAGFNVMKVWSAFGDPPQAVVVSARRRCH